MRLNGAVTLSGNATIRFEGIDGEQRIAGAINGDVAGRVLTLEVTPGAWGVVNSAIGAVNAVSVVKTGTGTLSLSSGATLSSGIAVNAGNVDVHGADVLAPTGNTVATAALLSFLNSAGAPMIINQAITAGGGVGGEAGIGLFGLTHEVRLTGAITLASRAEFVVFSGQHTIAGTLTVAPGTLASANVLAAGSLTIDNGAENDVGQFQKLNAGSFTVAAGTGLTAFVDVLGGSLYVNGTVTGPVSVAAGTRLGGSGVIRGDVAVNGTFAPGNSPGITTVAAGDVTFAPGSAFEAELGGATAGNGDGFHDQLLVQAGAINLGATAVLEAVQWAQAAPFTPVRGDVMTILRAAGGITGSFGDFVNQSYPTWLIYDNSLAAGRTEGRLFGTGLVRGQTFGDYSAAHAALLQRIWEASVTESSSSALAGNPAGFIDSSTGTGFAALTVLSAPMVEDAVALLGPGAHLAADDYVQTVMRSLQDADRNAVAVYGQGPWSLAVGYARAQHDYVGAERPVLEHSLAADTAFASVTRRAGSWSVGGFVGANSGTTTYSAGRAEYSGLLLGVSAAGRVPGRLPLDLRLSAVWADLSMDASRNTSAADGVGVTGAGAQAWAELEAWKSPRWSLSPALGLTYSRSDVDGFTETGGAALIVDPFEADSLRGFAGLTLRGMATSAAELSFTAGYEHEFAQDSRRAHGTFVDMPAGGIYPDAADATYDDPVAREGTLLFLASLGWRLSNGMTARTGLEYRDGGECEGSLRFNVSVGRRF
jgi:hypothetical protein